jgi:GTP-binding protein
VERILTMVDGVILLIDALDGPMPQTRFVLRKSLELGLRPIVVVNKVDRPFADPPKALNNTFDLFVDLEASDEQLDFPILYASGKNGWASEDLHAPSKDLQPLFATIIRHVPGPAADPDGPLQMLTTMVDYNSYVGRIAIGMIHAGRIERNQAVTLMKQDGRSLSTRVMKLYGFFGLERREILSAQAGDIVAVAGMEEARVGDTVAAAENPQALPPLEIDEPTLSIEFMVNDSPFSGVKGNS